MPPSPKTITAGAMTTKRITRAATLLDQMPSPVTSGFSQIPLRSDNHDGSLLPPGTARKRMFCFFTFQFQHGNKTYLPATGITRNHNGSAPLPQIKTSILCKQKINDQAILYQHILSLQNPPLYSFWISTTQRIATTEQHARDKEEKLCTAKLPSLVLRPRPNLDIDFVFGVIPW